jgi:hypothetical protein
MRKFNLNNNMTVHLTKVGWRRLRAYNQEDRECLPDDLFPAHDAAFTSKIKGDLYTDQAWRIMQIFGAMLYNGCEMPFHLDVVLSE